MSRPTVEIEAYVIQTRSFSWLVTTDEEGLAEGFAKNTVSLPQSNCEIIERGLGEINGFHLTRFEIPVWLAEKEGLV